MYNKDDVITYLLNAGGMIDTDFDHIYPVVRLQRGSLRYVYHMVPSKEIFIRNSFNSITNRKEREDIFIYNNLEEIGIATILEYFHN